MDQFAERREHEDGFRTFFDEVYPVAVRVVHRATGDRWLAEDLASEACARALARWSRLREETRRAWTLRVASNLAIDHLRRRERVSIRHERADDHATRVDLMAAVARLPRRQREVIALRFLTDMSEAQVASALGIAAGSVKAHTSRGLASLRASLGPTREDLLRDV